MLLVLISLHLDFLHLFSWDVFVFFLHDYPQSYIWKHALEMQLSVMTPIVYNGLLWYYV